MVTGSSPVSKFMHELAIAQLVEHIKTDSDPYPEHSLCGPKYCVNL